MLILQYLPYFLKRFGKKYLQNKLDLKLFYEDVWVMILYSNMLDYVILSKYVIFTDTSKLRKIMIIMNFIIIQTDNILNVNLIFKMFEFCGPKIVIMLKIAFIKSIVNCLVNVYNLISTKLKGLCILIAI